MHRPAHRLGLRRLSSRLGVWLVVLLGGLLECVALWRARWQGPADRAEA